MTTTAATPQLRSAPRADDGVRVTQRRVIRAEATKLWSLRSTRWCLALAVFIMIVEPVVFALVQMHDWPTLSRHARATFDPIDTAATGHWLAPLPIAFLGVLSVSGEYTTGTVRASFMAVPRRLQLLWAKLIVFGAVTFALMLVSSFVAFFITQAIVAEHHVGVSLGAPHALRVVVGTALMVTAIGMLGVALGALTRSTAAGAGIVVFLIFVLAGVIALLPTHLDNDVSPYLPFRAASTVATSTQFDGPHLSTWGGFGLFCAFLALVIALGAQRLRRGDA